ncbi:MAG: creatininase family protein [Deltaproteobacteria bacterium]|nr:creatininase family protein [Deltaproteobacteria bacterium]
MKVRFEEMRWPEIADVLKKTNVVILPIGATEQHGRHLPVNFDTHSAVHYANEVARRVSEKHDIRVLVAPTISYSEASGIPPFKKLLPGTISISAETVMRLIEEVVRSLWTQGFKNVLVINGHRENTEAIAMALRKVNLEFTDAGLFATSSLLLATDKWAEIKKGEIHDQGHAGERETAIAMALQPENVKSDECYSGSHLFPLPPKYVMPLCREQVFFYSRIGGVRDSGIHVKNPCVATKEIGDEIIEAVVEELIEIVIAIAKSESITHEEQV